MAIIMIVSLFTSRIVLDTLGVEDYGIYNIVGGVVVSLVFITNTLMSSTQRFLSYEIGKKGNSDVAKVFSMSINIHVIFVFIVLLIFETLGYWFLNNIIVIPINRIEEARIVYHFSVITFCVNLLRTPFNALIISTEQMNIFAVVSIVEAFMKVAIVYLLVLFPDKLVAYGFLMCIVSLILGVLYGLICWFRCQSYCKYKFQKDKTLFRNMLGFSGWNLLGGVTGVAVHEVPNYLINIFYGVSLNAAMGIAKQVSSAIYGFASNFQTAFNPQIVKLYAANDFKQLYDTVFKTSQLSAYLLMFFAIPIAIFSDVIFNLWLVDVPPYTIGFCLLFMASQIISAIGSPLWMLAHAIGNIKVYQIWNSVISIMILPIMFLILFSNWSVYLVVATLIFSNIIVLGYRLLYLRMRINFPVKQYLKIVISKTAIIFLCCCVCVGILYLISKNLSIVMQLVMIITSFVIEGLLLLFKGIDVDTRRILLSRIGFINASTK